LAEKLEKEPKNIQKKENIKNKIIIIKSILLF